MSRRVLPVLLVLLGCTGDPTKAPSAGTGGGAGDGGGDDTAPVDDTGEPGTCAGYGFPAPTTWALPDLPGSGPWRTAGDLRCGEEEEVLYLQEDLDGDGLEDLVMVRDCADADGTGQDHWTVFRGTGSGWEAAGVPWTLPTPQREYGWANTYSDSCEARALSIYTVTDVTGDDRPDLVVFDDCDETTPEGAGAWRVHVSGEGGFDPEGDLWTVAGATADAPFRGPDARFCDEDGGLQPRYVLQDVDGDGIADLLLTGDCGAHPGLGSEHWTVVRGTGSGFDQASPVVLTLPDLGEGVELPISSGRGCSQPSDIVFGFGDVDGDDTRDLIVSGYCDGRAEPGTTRWDVYPQKNGAFEPVTEMVMPDLGIERAWVRNESPRCSAEAPTAQAFWDVDGDEIWDVLLREMCTEDAPAGLGTDHYRLWLRRADGSLSEELRFEFEPDPEGTLYLDMQDDFCGHEGDAIVEVAGLNGDAMPDLITTYACQAQGAVGWTEWQVALGGCLDPSR